MTARYEAPGRAGIGNRFAVELMGHSHGGTPRLQDPPAVAPMPVGLKCCRRCGGDTHLEADRYGDFVCCLQCGFETIIEREPRRVARGPQRPGRPRAAQVTP